MSRLLLLGALLLASLPFAATSQEDAETLGVYVALGDSVAAGIGSSLPRERSYPALVHGYLEAHLDGSVILEQLAVPGETAESFSATGQLEAFKAIVSEAADSGLPLIAVSVSLGGNEILEQAGASVPERGTALDAFATSLDAALAEIRATAGPDVPVAITTVYDPTGTPPAVEFTDAWWIARFNDVIRDTAERHRLVVADVTHAFEGAEQALTRYPVDPHPTNAGHEVISRVVWGALGFDVEPPDIEVLSAPVTDRLTPTLRFSVSEPVVAESVTLSGGESVTLYPVVQVSDTEFVALLSLDAAESVDVTLTITARDLAGNAGRTEHTLSFEPRR